MRIWNWIRNAWARPAYREAWPIAGPAAAHPFDEHQAVRRFASWVYAAAMLNAQAVAAVPLRLYVRRRIGRKLYRTGPVPHLLRRYLAGDQRRGLRPSAGVLARTADWGSDYDLVTEPHPALTVLSRVNAGTTGFELAVLRMLYLQVTGNAYVHVVNHAALRRPHELWLMPSQWTRVVPRDAGTPGTPGSPDGSAVAGYTYGRDIAGRTVFDASEVIHWRLPSLVDPYYGMGRVEAVWSALGLHQSKRAMDLARFDNQARPDFLLVIRQGATPDLLDRFEKQVDQRLRGTERTGRFLTVSGDVHAQPLSFPPELIGDPDRVVEEIAAAFGVPVAKLLANHPNRANAQTANITWLRDTILPYCRLDEERLNEQYLPRFGIQGDAFLAYDNPVPEDQELAIDRRCRYVAAGIMSIDEARAEEGL